MGNATLEVWGPDAERWAAELRADLKASAHPGDSVSPVEVHRSADLVIAVIGLVFSGISTATATWGWWQSRRRDGVAVRVLFSDGTHLELSDVDQDELEITFRRAGPLS
jgi:hypothetical protein